MADSETPLLVKEFYEGCPGCILERKNNQTKGAPKKELLYIAYLVLISALPVSSLFPFVYYMVRDFGIAKSDTRIGTYAGLLGAAFMLGRFFASTPWGIVADRYGRKPVFVISTGSIIVFNTLFGFSSNFWLALTWRFVLGLSNGILGTIRAYASEICTLEHQALGLSMVGTMWGLGLIIGPCIGGYLAQPSDKYPAIFTSGSLFDSFPYALPCLCISIFAVIGVIPSFLLPESLHRHPTASETSCKKVNEDLEGKINGTDTGHIEAPQTETNVAEKSLWRNRPLVASISLYCIWGLHDMAYTEVFSLWCVSPVIYGGLGFTTSEVGDVLAGAGAALVLFQLFLFPPLAKMFGAIQMSRIPVVLTIPLVAVYPLMSRLSGATLWVVLVSAAAVKNILSTCIVTGSFIMINNTVVSAKRGLANGVSMTFMSLFKAVGPATAGILFSWAQERIDASFLPGMWLVFTFLDVVCVISLIFTFEPILPSSVNTPINEGKKESQDDDTLQRSTSFTF